MKEKKLRRKKEKFEIVENRGLKPRHDKHLEFDQ
jgi:hypothetical protein